MYCEIYQVYFKKYVGIKVSEINERKYRYWVEWQSDLKDTHPHV